MSNGNTPPGNPGENPFKKEENEKVKMSMEKEVEDANVVTDDPERDKVAEQIKELMPAPEKKKPKVSLKKDIKKNLKGLTELYGYSVLGVNEEGQSALATTYPPEISNILVAWHSKMLSTEEMLIIKAIAQSYVKRIQHFEQQEKKRNEQEGKEENNESSRVEDNVPDQPKDSKQRVEGKED